MFLFAAACAPTPRNEVAKRLDTEMPKTILWAWERPEDLRFIDPAKFGVAFLAQTITLTHDEVNIKKRRQPLDVPPGTYLIAVTRIETVKHEAERAAFDDEMRRRTVAAVRSTLDLPNIRGIQIDFDAVVSERGFYRKLMFNLRDEIDAANKNAKNESPNSDIQYSSFVIHHSFTMTSLASWCTGDAWFNDFPVDEAVPMAFVMGADSDKIKRYLANGNDWREPLCRGSYGISVDEPKLEGIKPNRRIYYFKNSSWKPADVEALQSS